MSPESTNIVIKKKYPRERGGGEEIVNKILPLNDKYIG